MDNSIETYESVAQQLIKEGKVYIPSKNNEELKRSPALNASTVLVKPQKIKKSKSFIARK